MATRTATVDVEGGPGEQQLWEEGETSGLLRRRVEELEAECERRRQRIVQLEEKEKRLQDHVDSLQRAGKRQASPFSKGDPKESPKKPGRKPGSEYGTRYFRAKPERADEEIDVPLPECCPCGGDLELSHIAEQWQTDVPPPPPPIVRRFRIHIGHCGGCGARHQPRHPLQTSEALGAASAQLGPRALALGIDLNKAYGLSWGKVANFVESTFGLRAARSTYCRASLRLAEQLEPTYTALEGALRQSPVVTPDETGWRAGGRRRWLWVFVGVAVTVFRIEASRGSDVVKAVLGSDYDGTVARDGWSAYRCLTDAQHQSCLGHLMGRACEILEVAKRGEAKFAHAVLRVFGEALNLRDRRDELSEHGFASLRGKIEAKLDWLLSWNPSYEPNARFRNHLEQERDHLLTFLYDPEVPATNWQAEQELRPAVLARKLSGCSRTDRGARAHAVHLTVLRTAVQQGHAPVPLLMTALLDPEPLLVDLLPAPHS